MRAVEFGLEHAGPGILAGAHGAGNRKDVGRTGNPGRGPRLQGGHAHRPKADLVKDDGKAVDRLVEQGGERLRRHVASGEAGAAGGNDHVDLR